MRATNASSSDWTKYFQRNIESWAPLSGFHGALCAQALAHSSRAGPVSAPVAPAAVAALMRVRRVNIRMVLLPPSCFGTFSDREPLARRLVEQMNELRIGFEPDRVARLELMTLAKDGDDLLLADAGDDLDLRACRLDHLDGSLHTVGGEDEVLGADAVDHGAALVRGAHAAERQPQAIRSLDMCHSVGADRTRQQIHRRRTNESGDEQIVGPVVEV